MNTFENGKNDGGINVSETILKISYEIKSLLEETHPKAIENINKHKETQMKKQNNKRKCYRG